MPRRAGAEAHADHQHHRSASPADRTKRSRSSATTTPRPSRGARPTTGWAWPCAWRRAGCSRCDETPRYTLVVALTDGEELGLMGARALSAGAGVRGRARVPQHRGRGDQRAGAPVPGGAGQLVAGRGVGALRPPSHGVVAVHGDLPPTAERHRLLRAEGVGRARAELRAHREHVRVSHASRHAGAAGTPHARHPRREHHPPGRGARADRHPPAHDRQRHVLRRGRAVRPLLLGSHDPRPGRDRVRAGPARRATRRSAPRARRWDSSACS